MLLYKKLTAYSRIYKFAGKKLQCVWYKSGLGGAPTPAYVQNHTPRGAPCQQVNVYFFEGVGWGWHGSCCGIMSTKKGKGITPCLVKNCFDF